MAEQNVVLVTGGARGIGAETARVLAGRGWSVAVADIDGQGAGVVAGQIRGLAVTADVGTEAGAHAAVEGTMLHFGRLDAIVSNAAINPRGPLATLTLETWERTLAINLTATMLLARRAEPELRARKGAIVAIASTRAHMSEPQTLPYSASKGGLVALTHALSMTLAPDVRVNCISPGWIDTGRHGPLSAADHAQHPAGRVGRPGDVAAAVDYLLSAGAGFMTGAEIVLDGGMTRKMIYV